MAPMSCSTVRGSVALSSLKSFVSAWDEEHETAWTLGLAVASPGITWHHSAAVVGILGFPRIGVPPNHQF